MLAAMNVRDFRVTMFRFGRWRWNDAREIIRSLKLDWLESDGMITRVFTVIGPNQTVMAAEYQFAMHNKPVRLHKIEPSGKLTFPLFVALAISSAAQAQNDDGSMGAPSSPAGQLNHDTGDLGSGGMDQSGGYPGFNDRYVSAPNEPGIFTGVGLETLHFGRNGGLTFTHEIDFDTGRSLSQPSGSMTTSGTLSGPV